jgi:signal transduction histidine kinase
VEEALTNAARYSPGASTQIRLTYLTERTTVSIENTPPPSGREPLAGTGAAALSGYGGGNGLAGMRERIESVGGTMRAGPTGQGWLVDLAVPTLEWSR